MMSSPRRSPVSSCLPILLTALVSLPVVGAEGEGTLSAAQIAGRLSALRQDGTSYSRMKMDTPEGNLQLQMKSRRSKGSSEVVYQILWPKERKGEAVLLRKSGNGAISGTHFTPPDKTRALDASAAKDSLFGGDLAYEDLVDNFFAWSSQTLVGTEAIDRIDCQILESKPAGARSIYGSVKTWVDTKRMVPMRVEKYSTSGQLVRRIDTTYVAYDDNRRSIPANFKVKGRGTTQIEGSKIRHDVSLTDRDFSPEGLANVAAPKGAPE
jgi:hypothetical protein